MEKLLNATEVAVMVGCSVSTLTMWYKWKDLHPEDDRAKILPDYTRYNSRAKSGKDARGTRMWNYSDIPKIIEFKNQIPKGRNGFLSEVTQKYVKRRRKSNADAR